MKRLHEKKIDDEIYYESIWSEEFHAKHGHKYDRVRMRALIADVEEGDTVLDVGAGVFGAAQFIAERRPNLDVKLTAFDQSYTARDIVVPLFHQIEWILGDAAERLPFDDQSFDVVIAGEILEHMEDPAAFASELMRVGRKGAMSTVDTECPDAIAHGDYPEHIFSFDEADLLEFFPGGRFEIVGNYLFIRWGQ